VRNLFFHGLAWTTVAATVVSALWIAGRASAGAPQVAGGRQVSDIAISPGPTEVERRSGEQRAAPIPQAPIAGENARDQPSR
jgi:hypothetical protein